MKRPFFSVVIPAFNEEARIVSTLEKVVAYLAGQSFSWELIVVDDGSTDDTAELVHRWASSHEGVRLEKIPHAGKGWAVRRGMLASSAEYRFMCDADLAMPVGQIPDFLAPMEAGYHIVVGSRQMAGANRFDEPAVRHVMGRLFNWTVSLLAVPGFQDTQCGFKCFRGSVADELFGLQQTIGFAFDVELLYLARKRGYKVLEVPIDWYHQRASKVRTVDSFSMLWDTLAVRRRALLGRYRPMPASQNVTAEPDDPAALPANVSVAIVVPTYNEAKSLPELGDRIFALDIPDTRLIIVDDNSPDGTARVATELRRKFDGRVEVLQRPGKQGLGTAYVEGFARALECGAEYVLQMDADLSHSPEYIPAFLEALQRADVVVGSRYVGGGGVDPSWSLHRRLLSFLANRGIRAMAGLRVKDSTSGFKAFRASALRGLQTSEFRCRGFGFQTEVAHACERKGYTVVEYPIVFKERAEGRSKMSLGITIEALWRLAPLRLKR